MRLSILLLVLSFTAPLSAQLMPSYKMTKRYSVRELQEWLRKNVRPRFITPADFDLTFQVNSGWKYEHNMIGGVSQVGAAAGRPSNKYNADLTIDYSYAFGRTKVGIRTAFRNSGGLFGGTARGLDVGRAFISYDFVTHGPFVCMVYVGRRVLLRVYNSQMQFSGSADGAGIVTSYGWEKVANLRFLGGLYISNNRSFYITRGEIFNIASLGFYFDYVYVHWGDTRPPAAQSTNGINVQFNTSQFLVGWDYKPQWINKDLKIFAALIQNHGATINLISHGSRESLAGYVGAQYGNAKKQNDFSIQVQLQFCQLQAIPPWDMSGIGTGRATVSIFRATSPQTVNDNTNFKGWEGKILYAVTDNLTLTAKVQRSMTLNKAIGLPFDFTSFKLETQYIF